MKKAVTILAIVGLGWFVLAKTRAGSYVSTLWSMVKTETKNQVPTRFEIDRVRHELAQLDADVDKMIRPMAEYMAAISKLRKDIQSTESNLVEHKNVLLTMARDLEGGSATLHYNGETFSADRVQNKLKKDFESYQRLELQLDSQRKLLEAKQSALKGTQEQMAKVMAKKREFELRLAQLEAAEETLQIAKLGSKLEIDTSRTTQIEAALADIEHRHNVVRAEIELRTGKMTDDGITVLPRPDVRLDPSSIRAYLEGTAPAATASR